VAKGSRYFVLIFCLILITAAAKAQEKPELFQEGQQIFNSTCADCHRSNGEGLPDTFLKRKLICDGRSGPGYPDDSQWAEREDWPHAYLEG
jgi:mono/diheme cytochrome c family protein